MNEIRAMARQRNIASGSLNKKELIRALQQGEGSTPCFMTGQPSCDQYACCWRSDCKPGDKGAVPEGRIDCIDTTCAKAISALPIHQHRAIDHARQGKRGKRPAGTKAATSKAPRSF